jgi:KDO2-lipid IV(A) lauroyltransferase
MTKNCTFYNKEYIDKAMEKGKGVIMITGHFGNFEWFAYVLAMQGYKVSGIAKRQSNPYVNRLIHRNRSQFGTKVIYTNNAMKDGLKALNNNEIIGLVADQDAKKKGIFIEFLGQPSSTAVGPAVFHLRSGAPVIFCAAIRKDYGKFDIHINPPFEIVDGEITDEKIRSITETHVKELEKWVRKYPEQWFWTHRRWKTRPEDIVKNRELE